jgi:hypothetical protein
MRMLGVALVCAIIVLLSPTCEQVVDWVERKCRLLGLALLY